MSVIDRMLRDLDARGAKGPPALAEAGAAKGPPANTPTNGSSSAPRAPQRPAVRLAAIALAGAAVIGMTAFADLGPLRGPGAASPVPVAVADTAAGAPALSGAAGASATPLTPAAPAAAATPPAEPAEVSQTAPATALATAPSTAPATAPAPAAAPTPAAASVRSALAAPSSTRSVTMTATPLPTTAAAIAAPPAAARAADRLLAPPTPPRIDKRTLALSPEQRLAQLYRQAVDAAQAGQRQSAIAAARELLAIHPHHTAARQLAAALEQEAGAPDRAAAVLREGLALPQLGTAQVESWALPLARLLATQGLADEALEVIERHALQGADAQGLRAGVLARRGDYAAALPAYEAAARAQPLQPMWWLGLGVALESLGEPARARQAYAKAQAIGLPREDLASYVDQRLRALE